VPDLSPPDSKDAPGGESVGWPTAKFRPQESYWQAGRRRTRWRGVDPHVISMGAGLLAGL